jgi:hypothetical protein
MKIASVADIKARLSAYLKESERVGNASSVARDIQSHINHQY